MAGSPSRRLCDYAPVFIYALLHHIVTCKNMYSTHGVWLSEMKSIIYIIYIPPTATQLRITNIILYTRIYYVFFSEYVFFALSLPLSLTLDSGMRHVNRLPQRMCVRAPMCVLHSGLLEKQFARVIFRTAFLFSACTQNFQPMNIFTSLAACLPWSAPATIGDEVYLFCIFA